MVLSPVLGFMFFVAAIPLADFRHPNAVPGKNEITAIR